MAAGADEFETTNQDWYTHPYDPSIVFTADPEVFVRLAQAPSSASGFRAIILKRSEEEKQRTRDEIKTYRERPDSVLRFGHPEKQLIRDKGVLFYQPPTADVYRQRVNAEHIPVTIKTLMTLFEEITGKKHLTISLFDKWRVIQNRNHDHDHDVLNVVSSPDEGVKGTVLPIKGHPDFQVEEGDFLFIKAGRIHSPEIITKRNYEKERTTIGVHPMIDNHI